jgi:hypothetical protein
MTNTGLIVAITALILFASPAYAGGLGADSSIETHASGIMECKSLLIARVLRFDARAKTTKVFSALIGSSEVSFIDIPTGDPIQLSSDQQMGYTCRELP